MQRNELKATILNEIATQHATPQQCSDKYNIPAGTIRSWLSRANSKGKHVANENATASATKSCNVAKVRDVAPDTGTKPKSKAKVCPIKETKPVFATVSLNEVSTDLPDKERLFCFRYIQNYNAPAAYVYAFDCQFSTARTNSYKLLAQTRIQAEISRLKKLKYANLSFSPDALIEKRMQIAFADITDFVSFGSKDYPIYTNNGPMKDSTGKLIMSPDSFVELHDSKKVDGGLISEISMGKHGPKIKLEDRQQALTWLENFFEINPQDKHRIEFERRRVEIEEARLELDKQKDAPPPPEGDSTGDGFLAALNAQAGAWKDYQDPEPVEDGADDPGQETT